MKPIFAERTPSRFVVLAMLLLSAGVPAVQRSVVGSATGASRRTQQDNELTAEERQQQRIMERFLTVLENRPRRGTALERVYGYHVEQGTLDALVKRYEDRVEQDQADGSAWMLLGLIHSQRGHDAAAVAAFRKAEEHVADDPLPCYYLGQSLVLVGQPDAAAEAFERALARNPERADLLQIYQALGRLYSRAHRTDEALAVWQRLEARFPEDLRVQEEIARALAEEQQLEPALERFARLSKRVEDEYRQVLFRMEAADLKVRLGRTPEALEDFEGLLGRLNPDSWLYREVRRNVEEVFLRSDDLAGLAEYYEGWIEKTPDDVDAMVRLARTLAMQGRAPEAQQWYDKAVELAPSREELRLALIEQFVFDGKTEEAIAQYEELDKLDRNNPDYVRDWGLLILQDTDRPEAERQAAAAAVWRRLTAAHPDDPVIVTQVADLFRQAEMTEEAIALYRKAVELAPENAQYLEYLGEYYHSLKQSEEALATWQKIAAGPARTAANLERLAEVTAGFGYLDEALEAIDEAAQLDPKNFSLGLRYADLLHRASRFDDALERLETLEAIAENEEEREAILEHQITNYRAAAKLDEQIEALTGELTAGKEATVDRWKRLARYLEAARRMPEATAAIQQALKLADESTAVLLAAARIYENSGNLLAAADSYRKLARMDRRFRTEHLTNVAKLEARLGRRDAALEAGHDLLAAAPGNPEHYEFFAQLCFQLGDDEQGFDALRRAVRVNASDPQALLTLAAALGDRFRTDEAIELYWRAFEKASDLDGRVAIVARLADLYLQTNHFDRLLEHLQRERRDSQQQREMTICLAHAHKAAGDFGTARQELERLLSINTRDTQLLGQLAALAESEGDVTAAADYQRQLTEMAPSNEGKRRLAELYDRAGMADEAETIWVELSRRENEPHRILQSLDSLARHGKLETVLSMSERLLREDPRDWEVLYRDAVGLFQTDKRDESAARFEQILDLRLDDDEESAIVKARKNSSGRAAGYRVSNVTAPQGFPLQQRIYSAYEIRRATGLDPRYYSYSSGQQATWSPSDFGQARMAALAWLLRIAEQKNEQDAFMERFRKAREGAEADSRPQWDWYYLQLVRQDQRETYEAAKALSQTQGGAAPWAYLVALPGRTATQEGVVRRSGPSVIDNTPPLSEDELDHVLACYDAVRRQQPEWMQGVVAGVVTELKRAERSDDEERIFRESVAAASQPSTIYTALSLAVNREDTEAAVALFDRLVQLGRGRSSMAGSYLQSAGRLLGQAMWQLAEHNAHDEIVRLLDHFLSAARTESRNAAAASRQSNFGNPYGNRQPYYYVWRAQNSTRSVRLDYPAPNAFYDYNSILLLRNAYEHFKRDDLLSDLVAHFQKQLETCPPEDRTFHHLALSYLNWWEEEKDAAVAEMTRAAESARDAASGLAGSAAADELQLELAELRERRGELDTALALVDEVRPLDHRAMQRRETAALRLAVQTGNVERARQAAERLFGLRLSSELQVQLAAQMHQLGMHELAEAVMARARRRAGNQVSALVSLMLQYQAQGKMEVATQVAHQILRRTPAGPSTPYRTSNDAAREQAIQILARSGKLQDMIARTEAQLERSPQAVQLQQTLADFYRASGDRDKAADAYERIAELRPDDARLRYQTAQQLAQAGLTDKAVAHYTKAIKQEPALFRNNYWEVQRTYQQANKVDELVQLLNEIDVRSLGSYYVASDIMQTLLRDPKTREQGLSLFRRFWEAFPDNRANLITNVYDDAVWRLPEMYEYLRAAVVPSESQSQIEQWSPVDYIYSWSSDGTVTGVVTRLMTAVERQNQSAALSADVQGALERFPQWSAGKALLAVLLTRQGETERAKELLEALLDDEKSPIPLNARWVIGQQLENYGPLEDLVLRMYEEGLDDALAEGGRNFNFSPAKRLVGLYQRSDKNEKARDLVLRFARRGSTSGIPDPSYEARQRVQELTAAGDQLREIGYPADAVRIYREVLRDAERLRLAESHYGGNNYFTTQAEQGLNRALEALTPETLASTLGELLEPDAGADPDAPAVQLMLLVNPTQLDQAKVTSLLSRAIDEAASNAESVAALQGTLDALVEQHPADTSVHVAAGLVALAGADEARIERVVGRLADHVAENPLEELAEGARANARQRADAAKQLGLWLVARECWQRESLREAGDRLAERALAAARRQNNSIYTLAMLREWGEQALEAGDRQRAEELWSQMLEVLTSDPLGQTSSGQAAVGQVRMRSATAPPLGAVRAAPAVRAAVPRRSSPARAKPTGRNAAKKTSGNEKSKQSKPKDKDDKKPATKEESKPADHPNEAKSSARDAPDPSGGSATASPSDRKSDEATASPKSVPVVTLDRFDQMMQLAKLAASKGMHELSLRAVREALRGGPPVQAMQTGQGAFGTLRGQVQGGFIQGMVPSGGQADTQIVRNVEQQVFELDGLWNRHDAPPEAVYDVLAGAVLPTSRPSEIFLYPRPLVYGSVESPRSVSGSLVQWALRAGRADELRRAVEARQEQPMAELPARVLLVQLGVAAGESASTTASLAWLEERLQRDTLQYSAELACHAALPALHAAAPDAAGDVQVRALPVVERIVANLSGQESEQPLANLHLALARYRFGASGAEEGRRHLDEYLAVMGRNNSRYSGDYGLYRRKQQLQQVGTELVRAGLLDGALDVLGQFADAPSATSRADPPVTDLALPVGRYLSSLAPRERYERLRAWAMPTEDRNLVRLVASFVPTKLPPAVFLPRNRGQPLTASGASSLPNGREREGDTSAAHDNTAFTALARQGVAADVRAVVDAREVFSSFEQLIRAGEAAGALDALEVETQSAVDAHAENARLLQLLIQIARDRTDAAQPQIDRLVEEVPERISDAPNDRTQGIAWSDYLVARACLLSGTNLRAAGRKFATALLGRAKPYRDDVFINHLHRDLALSHALGAGGAAVTMRGCELPLWDAVSHTSARSDREAWAPAWWVAHNGYIRHIAGSMFESLYFAYPLTGTFEISVDAYEGAQVLSNVSYGHVRVEPGTNASGNVYVDGTAIRLPRLFVRHEHFNRLTIQVEPGRTRHLINGHLYYEDARPSATNLWLALAAWRVWPAVFRNLRISGRPEIPREVPLTTGDQLHDWSASYYSERVPPPPLPDHPSVSATGRSSASARAALDYDWELREGVIHGRRLPVSTGEEPLQSRLFYPRPLRDKETLRYEFFYEPGETLVHPALGRLTFQVDPKGVRLHWMTDGPVDSLSGLEADNAVDAPADRRGPEPLPLREAAWNVLELSLDEGTVHLELNGQAIYERRLEPGNDRLFSFFHYKDRTAVQVRNVVLRGDWPEELSEEQLENLLSPAQQSRPGAQRSRASHAIVEERFFARTIDDVLQNSRAMKAAQRYEYLRDWVVPNKRHPTLRAYGTFLPGETGGALASPAAELVAAAKELGRLDDLLAEIEGAAGESDDDRRAKLAITMLVCMARDDEGGAIAALEQLRLLAEALPVDAPRWRRWPELVALWHAVNRPALRPAARELANVVSGKMSQALRERIAFEEKYRWNREFMHCRARLLLAQPPGRRGVAVDESPERSKWSPVVHATARSCGIGAPPARWTYRRRDGALLHWPGHDRDFLYYRVPLRGDFEVNCELRGLYAGQIKVAYAGLFLHFPGVKRMQRTTYDGSRREITLDPPLDQPKGWYPFRLSVKGGKMTAYLNGRKVHEEQLPDQPDPWLALHQAAGGQGGARNVQVTGNPIVPEALRLSQASDLGGWLSYYQEPMRGEKRAWEKRGEEIVGRLLEELPGSKTESVLQYHRPLLEDGAVEYEFYYDPEKVMVHPVLDRLVLLVEPDGVKEHRLTCGAYERTGLAADNLVAEADRRRGPAQLPLKVQQWNHVNLGIEGDTIRLHLNDELVYERELESHNRRTFGLFHYADETEVRVRNVTYRGDWPRALPAEAGGTAAVVRSARLLGVSTLAVRAARIAARRSPVQREAARPAASGSQVRSFESVPKTAQKRKSGTPSGAETRVPAVTVDRFDQIMQLAKLAASKRMHDLSLRAVQAGLRGGPPVKVMQAGQGTFGTLQRSGVLVQGLSGGIQGQGPSGGVDIQIVRNVEQNLFDLEGLWRRHDARAEAVYEVLAGAVLPQARAAEIFLYPRPLVYGGVESPRSTGALLARWATRAERSDELRRAVEARQEEPMAEVAARVLLVQLGLALGDDALTGQSLAWLEERVQKDTLQYTAELACHAALPALGAETADADEIRQRALAVVEQAVKNLAGQANEEPLASLHVALARYQFAASAPDEGRRHLEEYLAVTGRNNARYSGDYGVYRHAQQLQKVVFELARAGQLNAALEMLGQLADVPVSSNRQEPALAGVLGPITRTLEGLEPEERYELLRDWTLPAGGRNSVRYLARYVPRDSAPAVFLKGGPRATARRSSPDALHAGTTRYAVLSGAGEAEAIHQPGLFNSLDMLVRAASAAGKLDELGLEVRKAVEAKAQDAELLEDLLSIARGRGAELAPQLRERLAELEKSRPTEGRATGRLIEWQDYAIAQACLAEPALAELGREFARGLLVAEPLVQNWDDYSKITHLRSDIATSFLHGATGGRLSARYGPGLQLWGTSAIVPTGNHQQGVVPHWWIEHDGHVRHVVGPEFDYLFFKYPLAGEFEFSFDGYFGPHSGPSLTYGGLHFEPGGQKGQNANMISVGIHDRQVLATPFLRWQAFNRISVQVRPDKVRYLLNNHVYYEDNDPAPVSPWLALYTWRTSGPVYRSLRIIGSPTIPREVPLTFEDRLDGWSAGFYGGYSQPPRLINPSRNYPPPDQYQWSSRDGVIHGRRDESGTVNAQQDVLLYHRPLGDGETLRYEFYYVPGEYEVHPALGRLAFLLEPKGVRLHWMTDGPDDLWYGVGPDNAVDEPENCRGPTPIPLKTDDWNAVAISLDEGRVKLELNGELIYQRPLEPENGRLFGLFHYRDRSAVQVRNAVLRGDWPEQIQEELRANLLARVEDFRPTAAELRVSHAIVGEQSFAKAVDSVLRTAEGMAAEQRYDFLRDWVLANERHPTLRAYGTFLPGDGGATLEAPAAVLVATAKELGRVDELLKSVQSATPDSEDNARAKLAVTMLIHLQRGDAAPALAALEQLRPLSEAVAADAPRWRRWPELLAQWHAVEDPALYASGQALADVVAAQMNHALANSIRFEGRPEWKRELLHCRARLQLAARKELEAPRHWSPVVHATAASHGGGAPPAQWTYRADGTMLHWAGHGKDFLYFAVPLRGEFEITCNLHGFGPNQMNLAYGGAFLHMPDSTHLDWTDYGGSARQTTLAESLEVDGFYPFRLAVNKGTLTVYANGRQIDEHELAPEADPWLALYQTATGQGGVRNLKVVGSPEFPERLRLSESPTLSGWFSYYEEPMTGDARAWEKRGEEILGRLLENSPGSKTESLLQYHRPLLEDGELEYEFYYDPNRAMVHPALDRLVLLLERDGVKVHRLTDGAYERTSLLPDNVTLEAEHARGPAELPLKASEWNQVKLVVKAVTVSLYLNGEIVYQRPLDPHNRRTFGLFHYADESEARVRNVTYRGDWPHELPAEIWP